MIECPFCGRPVRQEELGIHIATKHRASLRYDRNGLRGVYCPCGVMFYDCSSNTHLFTDRILAHAAEVGDFQRHLRHAQVARAMKQLGG